MPGSQSIEGLASGFDISGIVDTIMKYERIPITYLESDKKYKTQQIAAFKAVEAKFLALKSHVTQMTRETSYNKAAISVSDNDAVSVNARGSVVPGAYDIRVEQLAQNHQIASQGFDNAADSIFGTGTISIAVGDNSTTTINIDEGSSSLVDIKNAINDANVGVTASIINDGSDNNPFRLLVTSDRTGALNDIDISVNLTGGENLDFENSSFDDPETRGLSSSSTSVISLGSSASFSGSTNKTYTFTITDTGKDVMTVGTDNITIHWDDGTNSGDIVVTQADNEVELIGDGADGLKLSFSAGELKAGDSFTVSTFAPLLQNASDAKITIGSNDGMGGSPITIYSDNNTFDEALPGLYVNVNKVTAPGEKISIKSEVDTAAIQKMMSDFVTKYNDVMKFINDQFTYNQETGESGVLFADFSLQSMQARLRSSTTLMVEGLSDDFEYKSLASLGIRSDANGQLKKVDAAALTEAIERDFDQFMQLFLDSGNSDVKGIEFILAGDKTAADQAFDVDITRAATKGYYQGASIADPSVTPLTLDSTNNKLKIKVDGLISEELVLSEGTYNSTDELIDELKTRISLDDKLKDKNIGVEWVDLGDEGYIKITSDSYGSRSQVQMITSISDGAFSALGLAAGTMYGGQDVEGTINGESATGKGQYLTGDEDNETTAGLKLMVTLGEGDISAGIEGTISFTRGLSSKIDKTLETITATKVGAIARKTSAIDKQVTELEEQIADYEAKLARRREDLYQEFLAMEEALSQYQSQGSYLQSQLNNIKSNWSQMTGGIGGTGSE